MDTPNITDTITTISSVPARMSNSRGVFIFLIFSNTRDSIASVKNGRVAELVYAYVSEAYGATLGSSSLPAPTCLKTPPPLRRGCFDLVRGRGLEPPSPCGHSHLKATCLPFHHPRIVLSSVHDFFSEMFIIANALSIFNFFLFKKIGRSPPYISEIIFTESLFAYFS